MTLKAPLTLLNVRFGLTMSPDAWRNFRLEFVASAVYSFFNVVFNQFYLPFAIRQGAESFQVGLLSAAPAIGLLLTPLWSGWIERTNPKPFFIWPNLAARALIVLPAFFGVPWVYVGTALVFHVLMGIQAPAYASLVTRIYPAPLRGRLMGMVRVAMGVLMVPIAFAVGWWTDFAGPSSALLAASVTGVVSILLMLGARELEPAPPRPRTLKRASMREQWSVVRENRGLALFLTATMITGFGHILVAPLYQILQVERLGLTNVEIGWARVAYYVCLIGAYLLAGRALDKQPPERVLLFGFFALAITPLLYGLIGSYPAVLVGSGLNGIGDAIWDIGILAYVFRIAPGREAVVFGLHLLLFGIRGTIGPLLSTSLVGVVPLTWLFLAGAVFGLAGTVLMWRGNRPAAMRGTGTSASAGAGQ